MPGSLSPARWWPLIFVELLCISSRLLKLQKPPVRPPTSGNSPSVPVDMSGTDAIIPDVTAAYLYRGEASLKILAISSFSLALNRPPLHLNGETP